MNHTVYQRDIAVPSSSVEQYYTTTNLYKLYYVISSLLCSAREHTDSAHLLTEPHCYRLETCSSMAGCHMGIHRKTEFGQPALRSLAGQWTKAQSITEYP